MSFDVYHFTDKNKKLGQGVFWWSIARELSCPGASAVCREICYGKRGRIGKASNDVPYGRRFMAAKSRTFVPDLLAAIRNKHPVAFRINDIGDYFSEDYVRKWIEIVENRRDIRFFGYTRSWWVRRRGRPLWPALRQLAAQPNMVLFLSIDRSMTTKMVPRDAADLPWAWVAVDDNDLPDRPVDLVFRNFRRKLLPLANPNHFGGPVCRNEDGITETTCRECGICWRWKEQR